MPQPGNVLNLVICGIVLLLNLLFGVGFCKACRARAEADPGERWWLVSVQAQKYWTMSWLSWTILYLLRVLSDTLQWSWIRPKGLLIIFSDLNSILVYMVFWGLTRGSAVDQSVYRRVTGILILCFFLFESFVVGTGCVVSEGRTPDLFLNLSSLCLAMFSMVSLGEAFWLRYRAASVRILAVVYAFSARC